MAASDTKPSFKRDFLQSIETSIQSSWEAENINIVDAPESDSSGSVEKFMGTFPYPYMNGRLHLGHAFTLTKVEFEARYQRMLGKASLFPLAYHCTGMPIKAAADKICAEMEKFGCPPTFDNDKADSTGAKPNSAKYQWQILQAMGIPAEEIPKFADPNYWLTYFPPYAQADAKALGLAIDHRRSFITTHVNPFYDSFVRWQFNKLRSLNRIKFDKRHTIFSPKDGQACLDHDRHSGEGVDCKEYTAIKLCLLELPACLDKSSLPNLPKNIFLLAATLRPETMYGQTNVWVGPDIEYGLFLGAHPDEGFICTLRAARNLAHQGWSKTMGKSEQIATMKGIDLIGLAVSAPLSVYKQVFVLPMFGVSASKGTGIVTSVPSNSPADFAALRDLRDKEALRTKFSLTEDKVLPFVPVSTIRTPELGDFPAETVVVQMGIRSQNDQVALEKAKDIVYKQDFYNGIMNIGPFKDRPVTEAKNLIKEQMIKDGEALEYWEPENIVISRSGDECVVALVDQWFINYGEPEWRKDAERCLSLMEVTDEVRHQFQKTLEWMHQWACSRSFGLGSRLPWDQQFLIESLSDSTIYMAYYTVAHILHEGSFDGSTRPNGILPEQMTDATWEWIFGDDNVPFPSESGIPKALLERMQREFRFFYPWDLRASGKDLVPNHLTMSIYNHVAIFPERFWPRCIRANGHLLLNSEKMSKSTGNFMTLREAVNEFGADATRLALADAGDSIEDANFLKETANMAILRLFTQIEFFKDALVDKKNSLRQESTIGDEVVFADKLFVTQINRAINLAREAYSRGMYRDVVKYGFFELQNARDQYRDATVLHGSAGMDANLIRKFTEIQALLMLPITPHFSEYVWKSILNNPRSILYERYPEVSEPVDETLLCESKYLQEVAHSIRTSLANEMNPKKKKASTKESTAAAPPNSVEVYVASSYPKWEEDAIVLLKQHYNQETNTFASDSEISSSMKPLLAKLAGKTAKKLMPFVMEIRNNVLERGPSAFERRMLFDEHDVLCKNIDYLTRSLGVLSLSVKKSEEASTEVVSHAEAAAPGTPSVRFFSQS